MFVVAANGTQILTQLRTLMVIANVQAYIVPSGDAHYTEFIAECHQRRAFISGFTGSAGTAIVTSDEALLWTDGRYFLQAEQQLDPALWTLMRDGQQGVPSQAEWLKDKLPNGGAVGVDPTLYSKRQWDSMSSELSSVGKSLTAVHNNLIDEIWNDEGRPPCAGATVMDHGLQFSGKTAAEKLANVRTDMRSNSADVLIVAELDEVAWLLNLRGGDIPYSSTFFSYVIATESTLHFFIKKGQLTPEIIERLQADIPEIQIHNYGDVETVLRDVVTTANRVWFNQNTNYALVSLVNPAKQFMQLTPIALMKAQKNPTEVTGYRKCLIRDAAALCEFFAWLEPELASGATVTEISASEKLASFRAQREYYFKDSFQTISATGANAAVIHYMPTPETDTKIEPNDMYLLDSGGLYRDGTTDITRTRHFGTPTEHQKNCYTRVLKGQIALAKAIYPSRTTGQRLDSFARQYLWEAGLDYNHGTGHGVGSFLNIHEGPFSIGSGYSSVDPGFRENFITSNEPGYYEDNAFGIRLENLIRVANVSLDNNFQNRGYLAFEDLTFVPYDHKLIDFSLLTEEELEYFNNYQERTRTLIGGYIRDNNMTEAAYQWMWKSTVPVNQDGPITEAPPTTTESPTTTTPEAPTTSTPGATTTTTESSATDWKSLHLLISIPLVITWRYIDEKL